ncbi:MAG: hypothetical protein JO200_08480 [Comamonas sp.]|nr:hypothetical protein [Comamonas sp.]
MAQAIKFPCVRKDRNSGMLVLFTAETRGTVIKACESMPTHPVGFYSDGWAGASDRSEWGKTSVQQIREAFAALADAIATS